MFAFSTPLLAASLIVAQSSGQADQPLADYFGFDDPRFLVVDNNMGPAVVADIDSDGKPDLVVVNNRKSRIELHLQRPKPLTDNELEATKGVNHLPPSRFYDRREVSVSHQIKSLCVHDFDSDGRPDIIYAGRPASIVSLHQAGDLDFEEVASRRLPDLSGGRGGLKIANVRGTDEPELVTLLGGHICVFDLQGPNVIGDPTRLGSADQIAEIMVDDFDGDGLLDIAGAIPDDAAPLRLWRQVEPAPGSGGTPTIGPEIRFEMPPLVEATPIRFRGRPGASIGVIESQSRRVLFYDVVTEQIKTTSTTGSAVERDVPLEVYAFPGDNPGSRAVSVADIDRDGLADVLVANPSGNALSLHLQEKGSGIREGESFSTFKNTGVLAAGQWNAGGPLEVFVLSEDENVVGVSTFNADLARLEFPRPLPLANPSATPVAMTVLDKGSDAVKLAVVVRDRRDHWLEILSPTGEPRGVELDPIDRPPSAIISGDFDGDGATDVLLTADGQPPVMVRSAETAQKTDVLDDEAMPQVGLIQAAGPANTAVIDIDGDGKDDLLIADDNFVRACVYDADTGWRVAEQMTVADTRTAFAGLTISGAGASTRIAAADTGNNAIVVFARDTSGPWSVADRMRIPAFDLGLITAGAFSGDGEPNILCESSEALAIARLSGERVALEQFASYRSDNEDQYEHEMAAGDINGDGYTDVVVLDAGEQRCKVFTLTASRKLLKAFEFQTFQRRLFDRSEGRTFEPRDIIFGDLSGDGIDDLVFEVHDRYVIHPAQRK